MNITWTRAALDELTPRQVHDLLKLRVDVFVVEQRCAYPEVDGRDPDAVHVLGHVDGTLVACCRVLPPGEDDLPHIGRVVVHPEHRGRGLARVLMLEGLSVLHERYGNVRSAVAAQSHLEAFYGSLGYVRVGPDYDWDGIPHVDMVLSSPGGSAQ
jgi:ElaA protein